MLTGEHEGYYEDFQDAARLLARCMVEGFAYQGEVSPHSGKPRGEPSAGLPTTAFVICLQNHDQIGNRAFGERLSQLAASEALRAATALLLLSPFIPMLFMGEEWGTRTPFLFFTDHNADLAELVRNGRRKEFARFSAFADPGRRESDPRSQRGQDLRRLGARSRGGRAAASMRAILRLHGELLALRHRFDHAGHPGLRQRGCGGDRAEGGGRALAAGQRGGAHLGDQSRRRAGADRAAHRRDAVRHRGENDPRCAGRRAARLQRGRLSRRNAAMSDTELLALAEQAGVAPRWRDAFGRTHDVTPDTLRAVLRALDLPAGSDAEIRDSRAALDEQGRTGSLPPLVTAVVGQEVRLPVPAGRFRVTLEDGRGYEGSTAADAEGHAMLGAVAEPGYHQLEIGDVTVTLAVSPGRCVGVAELCGAAARPWGLAVQLYGLRRAGDGGIGDFAGVARVRPARRRGTARRPWRSARCTRNSPPTRTGSAPTRHPAASCSTCCTPPLPDETRRRASGGSKRLRTGRLAGGGPPPPAPRCAALYDQHADSPALEAVSGANGATCWKPTRASRRCTRICSARPGRWWNWRDWPDGVARPAQPRGRSNSPSDHAAEVGFHAWLQWRADQGLAEAQRRRGRRACRSG